MKKIATLLVLSCLAIGCSSSAKTSVVRVNGLKGDGTTNDTAALQAAIDAAAKNGGEVVVPAGKYLIGSIELRSHTTLRLEKDAVLVGSSDKNDYPLIKIRWEGRMRDGHRALIFAQKADDIAIVGPGKIEGAASLGPLRNPRAPSLIEFLDCHGITLRDFSTQYARMWSIHPTFCSDIKVSNVFIRSTGGNGDGIDLDSCRNVAIDHCDIDTGDDAIVLKSGRGSEGYTMARPTENVHVSDCTLGSSFAGFAIGTEMSGGVRNVLFERCTFTRGSNSVYIKSRIGRGGFIENIEGRDLDAKANAFLRIDLVGRGIQDEQPVQGDAGIPSTKNFRFSNVKADVPFLIDAVYIPPEKPLDGLSIANVSGKAGRGIELANIRSVELRDIHVDVASGAPIAASNVSGVGVENAAPLPPRRPSTRSSTATRRAAPSSQP